MQRTGADGEGSLKIPTSSSSTSGNTSGSTGNTSGSTGNTSGSTGTTVPEPGMLALLGIGLLGQALILRQRRRSQQK
jgi:hypothetical protein